MKLQNILIALSLTSMSAGVALAKGSSEKNCEVKGKKVHVKDETACTKKKGTWMSAAASAPATTTTTTTTTPPADTTTTAPAPAGTTAAPADGATK